MKKPKCGRSSLYVFALLLLFSVMVLPSSEAQGGQFPKSVSGFDNPKISWAMGGEEFRLVLGWKSDYSQSLNLREAYMDDQGYIHVKASTSCHGCIMRLYQREGDSWKKLDEKKAHARETYTLRGLARAPLAFPKSISGPNNPEIAWAMEGEQLKLVLGWKSDHSQALTISEAFRDDQGYIHVKASTSCHGCIMRLYRREGDSWKKLDEKKAHAHKAYTLSALAGKAGPPDRFPMRQSGNQNPAVMWQMGRKEFKLEVWWQDPTETGWIQLSQADLREETLTVSGNTSCEGCWVALYEKRGGSWKKRVVVKSLGRAFAFGFVTE